MIAPLNLSRRHMLAGGVASALSPLFGSAARGLEIACGLEIKPKPLVAKPERAISLRRLSAALAEGRPARLQGITRLDGYVTDTENQDVILWGLAERDQPELQLADLVVALRAGHRRNGERDGVDYKVAALISIDPDPEVFRALGKIGVMDTARKRKHAEICRLPQTVRVEGMPRHTRVSKVLVDADYRMKKVSQGTANLPISSPFPATHASRLRKWRDDINASGRADGLGHHTRYWFEPGRFTYQMSKASDTVFLDYAQVALRDEDQHVGGGDATGKVDPVSRAFACAWTQRMEDVERAEPVWRDMHNIFRLFAVARIMADRRAFDKVLFGAETLLDRYEIPRVEVGPTLPGLGRWDEFERKNRGGMTRFTNWVCGGVGVGFGRPLDSNEDPGDTANSGRIVLAARPDATAVSWAVDPASLKGLIKSPSPAPSLKAPAPEPKKPGTLKDLFKT